MSARQRGTCGEDCTVDCGPCKGAGYSANDTWDEAWAKFHVANPQVLASWREQNNRWPSGHPRADLSGVTI